MKSSPKKERFDVLLTPGKTEIRKKEAAKKRERTLGWYYLGLVGEIGFVIALPIVAGVLAGVYIDKWLGTKPTATILLLLIGIGISFIGFFNVIGEIIHKKT